MSAGLLIIRIVLGALLAGHGTQKLFGWWGGHGPKATGEFMESLGHRPGRRMAITAGVAEAGGGLLIALGLFFPIGAAVVVAVMVVAASAHYAHGVWNENRGFELPIVYAVTAGALAMTGPGTVSIDEAIGWHYGAIVGFAAALFGVAGAMLRISAAHDTLAREAGAAPAPADHDATRTEPLQRERHAA